MHAIFMLYGIQQQVNLLLRDMQAQKFEFKITSPEGKEKVTWLQGSLRSLPGGIYDYVFPKESADLVLTTLDFHAPFKPYNLDKKIMGISPFNLLKDWMGILDIPKFDSKKTLLWVKQGVTIIPIGVKYDKDMTEKVPGEYFGWKHEAV